eukprot:3641921-Prymnesium_polylepis.2
MDPRWDSKGGDLSYLPRGDLVDGHRFDRLEHLTQVGGEGLNVHLPARAQGFGGWRGGSRVGACGSEAAGRDPSCLLYTSPSPRDAHES